MTAQTGDEAIEIVDDTRARRNAVVFAISQAIYGSTASVLITLGGLVGLLLAPDKSLATLPITFFIMGSALTTLPASWLMRKIGRRPGFTVGTLLGAFGAGLSAYAIWLQSFYLFCFAVVFMGCFQAFAGFYRYAAADTASESFKPKVVSWVLVGGVASAFIGPTIVVWMRDFFPDVLYAGPFVAICGISLFGALVLRFIDIPHVKAEIATLGARPLGEILKQPRLLTAIFCCMVSYATMNLIMTATPLAMVGHHHSVSQAAIVIQWHIVAMFLPSFFTGGLIGRFGKELIVALGMVLFAISGIISLLGTDLVHFWFALVFLGLGWNFGFIGGTTLVLECYEPSERNKVQGITDFAVFSTVAVASFTSGSMLNAFGWESVQFVMFPMVAVAFCLIMLQRQRTKQATSA